MLDKLKEYNQRQKEWRDISTTQLSIANNILITISSGYLALIFDKNELRRIHIDLDIDFDWALIFYLSSILLTLVAILLGVLVLFTRLHDFRISRNIALTRQRVYKKHKKPLSESSVGSVSLADILVETKNIFFRKIDSISIKEVKNFKNNRDQFTKQFNQLRRQSKILGITSHSLTKLQVFSLLFSLALYISYVLKSSEVISCQHIP